MNNHIPRIIVAPNALKGSLSAKKASLAIKKGIIKSCPYANVSLYPMADGGDGMLEAFSGIQKISKQRLKAPDPLGREIQTRYGLLSNKTAIIEMSLISGLALLKDNERDILNASTFGLGSVIIHALNKGITRFIIGIGGSATNDAGAGMLQALGYSLKDKSGRELSHGAAPLAGLAAIIPNNIHKALKKAAFTIACDVNNPLLGKRGASAIFGPQKGAKASQIPILENSLKNLADVIKNSGYVDYRNSPGSGAAGGIGYVFKSLLKAELIPGAQLLLNECNFYQNAKKADLIITAEGALDSQTADGKLPMYICQAGCQAGVPVIAIAGKLDTGWSALKPHGLTAAFSLTPGPVSLQASIANASTYLQNTAQEIISVFINSKRQYIPEATCI